MTKEVSEDTQNKLAIIFADEKLRGFVSKVKGVADELDMTFREIRQLEVKRDGLIREQEKLADNYEQIASGIAVLRDQEASEDDKRIARFQITRYTSW